MKDQNALECDVRIK